MASTRTETDTFGPIEVDASRYWGAQTQRSLQNFKIGWEKQPKPVVRALGVIKRAAAEANVALGRLDAKLGETIVAAAQEVIDGQARRAFPAGGLADRLGHPVEHERQRGDLEPGDRDAGRRNGLQKARPPQRPRQHEPVVERHLSDGHAHRRRRAGDPRPVARPAPSAHRLGRQAGGVQGHHQDRPHPHPGCDAAHPGPGVLRIRDPGRQFHQADRADSSGHDRNSPRAAPPWAPG